jgi:hypothetical protein
MAMASEHRLSGSELESMHKRMRNGFGLRQREVGLLFNEINRLRAENASSATRSALEAIRRCAAERLAEIDGDTLTYEDAFRKLEIACGALIFIEGQAAAELVPEEGP